MTHAECVRNDSHKEPIKIFAINVNGWLANYLNSEMPAPATIDLLLIYDRCGAAFHRLCHFSSLLFLQVIKTQCRHLWVFLHIILLNKKKHDFVSGFVYRKILPVAACAATGKF